MEFDWDEQKRQSNLEKHGVDFVDAVNIFFKPVLETVDERYSYDEIRLVAYGEIEGIILYVVYTWRDSVRRIISARRANKRERRKYYQNFS